VAAPSAGAPAPGLLIALEGGEGAGKSTQAAKLAAALDADLTREPGGTELGERVRRLLLDPAAGHVDDWTELLLMLAARAQHLAERIEPELQAGRHVVVDRYSGSTLAYQGHGRRLPLEDVRRLCELATRGRWADLNVLVDVPVELGAARRGGRPDPATDRIEAETFSFHERVRQGYLVEAAADPERWLVVDGSGSPEEVAAAILEGVQERLGLGLEATQ
jgi:dTMP kinase